MPRSVRNDIVANRQQHFGWVLWAAALAVGLAGATSLLAAGGGATNVAEPTVLFPLPLDRYPELPGASLFNVLRARAQAEPFNLIATAIFVLAIVHTFLVSKLRHWAHAIEARHQQRLRARPLSPGVDEEVDEVSFGGQILHFLGEVEAVFGIWAVVLVAALAWTKGWGTVTSYVGRQVDFTEASFVVVIMALASTRPILVLAERCVSAVASLGRGSVAAWWGAVLTLGPLLGSFMTEPAAMTISALLLARHFYPLKPSPRFCYATLGLLFVNVSVGGTLTHFAAPPVLMVAGPWRWDTLFMLQHFGARAAAGIAIATIAYGVWFRREFRALELARSRREATPAVQAEAARQRGVPAWITAVQLGFVAFTVLVAHYPALFIGGFLFFLAFSQATAHQQGRLDLRPPLLVGFFLAGLVVHGGLQGWWIEPVLRRLNEHTLFFGATALTAVNDNAAITFLATLVPDFSDALKYAVVAGAVTGGGLTVIANAPNPAGQAILSRFFPDGVSPLRLLLGALLPTAVMAAVFLAF